MIFRIKEFLGLSNELKELQLQNEVLNWKLENISRIDQDISKVNKHIQELDHLIAVKQILLFG